MEFIRLPNVKRQISVSFRDLVYGTRCARGRGCGSIFAVRVGVDRLEKTCRLVASLVGVDVTRALSARCVVVLCALSSRADDANDGTARVARVLLALFVHSLCALLKSFFVRRA